METKCPVCGSESQEVKRETIIKNKKLTDRVHMRCPRRHHGTGVWFAYDDSILDYGDSSSARENKVTKTPAKKPIVQADTTRDELSAQEIRYRESLYKRHKREQLAQHKQIEESKKRAEGKRQMRSKIRRYTED